MKTKSVFGNIMTPAVIIIAWFNGVCVATSSIVINYTNIPFKYIPMIIVFNLMWFFILFITMSYEEEIR